MFDKPSDLNTFLNQNLSKVVVPPTGNRNEMFYIPNEDRYGLKTLMMINFEAFEFKPNAEAVTSILHE